MSGNKSDDSFFGYPKQPVLSKLYPRSTPDLHQLVPSVPVTSRQYSVPSTSGSRTINCANDLNVPQRICNQSAEVQKAKHNTKQNTKKINRTRTLEIPAEKHCIETERHFHRQRVASVPDSSMISKELYPFFFTDDMAFQRLRNFSVKSKRVINRGDSFRFKEDLAPKTLDIPHLLGKSVLQVCENNSSYQVVVIGSPEVGKSSLIYQFTTSEYICSYDETQDEGDEKLVTVILNDEESELLFIEQTMTERKTDMDLTLPTDHADAYVVVYSVTNRESFQRAKTILNYIKNLNDEDKKAIILVGNKTDLARLRIVGTNAGRDLATSQRCKFIETSAGINYHVDELLVGILSQIRLKRSHADRCGKQRNSVSLDKTIGLSLTAGNSFRSKGGIIRFFQKTCRKSKSCVNLQVI
ncbi:GTP-binding protein REM 1-like [Limulus polyphemus]|uniref:GTP-binding protein REM 1-like n=1 Tax=Limulus polyphemus TaxID=6850 RepID=A0ABM1SMG7_LIMPO|nr:GTP-binding protein REM 1-like [Limulus polyphemus]